MMTYFRRLAGKTAGVALLTTSMLCAADAPPAPGQPSPARTAGDVTRLQAVRAFADNVLAQGHDRWSGQETPLLADGIDADTGEPVAWRLGGRSYLIHNLASQQNLFRVLVGLTNLTGDERYKATAIAAIRYHFDHLVSPCGKLRWGGHQFIDLQTLKPVGHIDVDCHEFKANFPFYELMWEVNPEYTARFLRALWAGHVTDWSMLMMNRHAPYGAGPAPGKTIWERSFANPEPYFESRGLSFLNCGADLIYGGAMLYHLGGEQGALDWALRMANMYTKARHPDTGMGAYQYTKPRRVREPPAEGPLTEALHNSVYGDRIENKFGHSGSSDPEDEFFNPIKGKIADDGMLVAREGWVWSISGGFPWYTLMQLNLAERIGDAARVLAEDAADHLEAHARHAYDPEANHFRPMWADGTDVTGLKIPRTGYGRGNRGDAYDPRPARTQHLAAYARAHRLSRRPLLWQTARSMALGLGLGDPGELPGENPSLRVAPDNAEPEAIFALLEMFKTAPHPAYLEAARALADNIVEHRFHKGFFLPSKIHYNANFDAVEPLAILAVEAAIAGRLAEIPPYIAGGGYIHGRFDGHGRTYDHRVIWNQTRCSIRLHLDASSHYGRHHGSPSPKEGFHHFNGEDDSVVFPAPTAFEDNDPFSIVIRVRAFDNRRFLCAFRYHLSRKEFRTRGTDGLRVGLDIDDSDVHVIVITYDGASPDGTRTLTAYVDGKRVDQATGTGSPLSSYPARHLHVGKTEHSGGVYANVAIDDDIRIFRRVLDAEEIARAINSAR